MALHQTQITQQPQCVCVCPCEKLPLHTCPPLHLCGLKYSLFHHILSSKCPPDRPYQLSNWAFSFYSSFICLSDCFAPLPQTVVLLCSSSPAVCSSIRCPDTALAVSITAE